MNRDNLDQILSKFDLQGAAQSDLQKAAKLVLPKLDAALEQFYAFAEADPEIIAFFANKEMVARARGAQKRHWELLLKGDFSEAYFESAERIGQVHFRIQLPFLFYLSGYSRATSYLQGALVAASSPLKRGTNARMLGALTRVFALDTHAVIESYFAAQQKEQNTAFDHVTKGIERMVARDLTTPIPCGAESDFPMRYDHVRVSFNTLMDNMSETIATIQQSIGDLTGNANEVSDAAQNLSHRTESQAATLEETAAAVEQMTSSVRSSSEATAETNTTAANAYARAEEGNKVIATAVQKMQEMSESSSQMSQIIGAIDDIAFQTNLLALNAGVEAARAGESGRGFAVVASEVRALAQRASASAREISDLINVSSSIVAAGVDLVNRAGQELSGIVTDVEHVSELTSNIATSSREQFTGLTEINTGVSHLDQVTQQNAAMFEETTAAVLSMQQGIQTLDQLVRSFQVSGQVSGQLSGAAASTAPTAADTSDGLNDEFWQSEEETEYRAFG